MNIRKEGWLTKQGAIIKNWKRRYFVLTDTSLSYYEAPNTNLKGTIPFDTSIYVEMAPKCKKQPAFKISTANRVYYIVAQTEYLAKEWVAEIKKTVENQVPVKREIPPPIVITITKPPPTEDDFEVLEQNQTMQVVKDRKSEEVFAMKKVTAEDIEPELPDWEDPFLVPLKKVFVSKGELFLLTKYVKGDELFLQLKKEGVFEEERAQLYAAEILSALEYLHSCGVAFGDLKPQNVLVDQTGHVQLTDFGVVRTIHPNSQISASALPGYTAPEVYQSREPTFAGDWWSFGALLFEMMTGSPPFCSDEPLEVEQKALESEPSYPSHLSEDAVDLIHKLLQKDPTQRLGSSAEDATPIKEHPFFQAFNWLEVPNKRVHPGYIPTVH